MKTMRTVAALAVASLCLTACAGQSFIRPDPKLSPAIQEKQAETAQAFYKALGDRLQYCTILGNFDAILKAQPDAGVGAGAGLSCPAKPWEQSPSTTVVPLSDIDALIQKRIEESRAAKPSADPPR